MPVHLLTYSVRKSDCTGILGLGCMCLVTTVSQSLIVVQFLLVCSVIEFLVLWWLLYDALQSSLELRDCSLFSGINENGRFLTTNCQEDILVKLIDLNN